MGKSVFFVLLVFFNLPFAIAQDCDPDTTRPNVKCILLSAQIWPSQSLLITPAMIDGWSSDNCSDANDLDRTIQLTSNLGFLITDRLTELIFHCDAAGSLQNVRLWVMDESGNEDFCTSTVFVEDNEQICEPGEVAGTVFTPKGNPIPQVFLYFKSKSPQQLNFSQTESDGQFYSGAEVDDEWIFYLEEHNSNILNGVSTADIIPIRRHLLGIQTLSALGMIAADANNDGKNSTIDIVHVRRVILSKSDEFPGHDRNWRFFFDPGIDQDLIEVGKQFTSVQTPTSNQFNFIGVKIGDTNFSWQKD